MVVIFIFVLGQCLMIADGIQYSRNSNPLKKYSCLEETHVTYIKIRSNSLFEIDEINKLLSVLEDPCTNISFLDFKIRKIVQWKDEQSKIKMAASIGNYNGQQNDRMEFVDFIQNLYDQKIENGSATKKIFLIETIHSNGELNKEIELLEKTTNSKVILICADACPINTYLPVHRIVEKFCYNDFKKRVKDLVLNLDFNKFKYLKYVKINNKNLTCLENKTVHIVNTNTCSLEVLEKLYLIKHNIHKFTDTKFIFYMRRGKDIFSNFLKQSGLDRYNISIAEMGYQKLLIFNGINNVYFFEAFLSNYMQDISFNNSINSRSSVVIYDSHNGFFKEYVKQWYTQQKDFRKTVEKYSYKIYKEYKKFIEKFIEDMINASCF